MDVVNFIFLLYKEKKEIIFDLVIGFLESCILYFVESIILIVDQQH